MIPKQTLRTAIGRSKNTYMQTFQTTVPPNVLGGEHVEFELPDGRKVSELGYAICHIIPSCRFITDVEANM